LTTKTKFFLAIGGAVALICVVAVVVGLVVLLRSGVTQPVDNMFGDQHLKTAVALIELHKVRNGRYPERLSDLKFTGQWDALALSVVEYCVNDDQTAYFIDVRRGWVARPNLRMPEGFWRGTGFDPELGPCR